MNYFIKKVVVFLGSQYTIGYTKKNFFTRKESFKPLKIKCLEVLKTGDKIITKYPLFESEKDSEFLMSKLDYIQIFNFKHKGYKIEAMLLFGYATKPTLVYYVADIFTNALKYSYSINLDRIMNSIDSHIREKEDRVTYKLA